MKKNHPEISIYFKPYVVLLVTCLGFIYSCHKDDTKSGKTNPSAIAVSKVTDVKTWYESTFPKHTAKTGKTTNAASENEPDLTQVITPGWDSSQNYNRYGMDVVETGIDQSGRIALKTDLSQKQNYSRSSYIIQKQGNQYEAYLMTIIGDAAYINNNFSKLEKNKYNKRDPDFSGIVYYATPQGKFVDGWVYKNGILTSRLSTPSHSENGGKVTQDVKTDNVLVTTTCIDFYQQITVGEYVSDWVFIERKCTTEITTTGDSGIGGGGSGSGGNGGYGNAGSGSSGGSGGSSTAPTGPPKSPCDIVIVNPANVQNGKLVIQNAPALPPISGDDGGFPPPGGGGGTRPFPPLVGDGDPTPVPCPPKVVTIKTDSLKKNFPCAVKLILDKLAQNGVYGDFVKAFTTNQRPDLVWQNGTLPWNVPTPNSTGKTYQLGETGYNGRSATITLNTSMLQNSSQLLITAAVIHETLHAYINYNIETAVGGFLPPSNYNSNGSWLYTLNTWAMINGLPSNYTDHYQMINDYFSKAINISAALDNNQHTTKEYAMAMLFGLDNAKDGNSTQQALLQAAYNSLLIKYGIKASDLNTFNIANLNSTSNKLPTTGCN